MSRVITFGEIMLRLAPNGYYRFFQNDQMQATFGGGEANVAVSLANYGLDSAYVTKLPAHAIGQAAVDSLRYFGVDTSRIAVPPELERAAWDCVGYCDLDIQDGKLVGLTPRELPPRPEPEPQTPSAEERLGLLEEALAQTDETAIALFESQAEQASINAQQDDALLGIYEMLGG